jgi:hypothetical protein
MLMSGAGRAARLHYLPSTFRVLSDGDHVICAVTGSGSAPGAALLERPAAGPMSTSEAACALTSRLANQARIEYRPPGPRCGRFVTLSTLFSATLRKHMALASHSGLNVRQHSMLRAG